MVTFLDFIDYCIEGNLINNEKKKHIQIPGIVDEAIKYVNLFVSSVRPNLYDEDGRYSAINHIYAAGAFAADNLSRGSELSTISQALASDDALMLIMYCSKIDRVSVDAMSTSLEVMAADWVDQASDKAESSLRLSNMLVGTFLLGFMTFMK